jgi:hypothetical protein
MKAQSKKRTSKTRMLKNLVILSSLAILAVGCGNQNTSGKGDDTTGYNGYGTPGTYGTGQYGQYSMDQIISIVGQENQCAQGGQRSFVQVPLNGTNVNIGSSHVGVSSFGDIAIVHNINGGTMMDLYICQRAGASGQGQLLQNPVLEASQNCPVGQITAADLVLSGQQQYQVKFAPIHIPGTNRYSQVCATNQQY